MKKLLQHTAIRSISGVVLLLIVFFTIVSAIGYRSFTDALLTQYAEGAFLTAQTAAQHVDGERIGDYLESGGTTEEYLRVLEDLENLCNTTGSTFIYVILPDRSDYAHITFLFSTMNKKSHYTRYDFGYVRETTNDDYRAKYKALFEQTSERELVIRDRGYIETDAHITAMISIRDKDGEVKAILCVQRQMEALAAVRRSYVRKTALALAGLVLLVVIGQSIFLHKTLLRPLKMISDEALRFSGENVKAPKKLSETIRNKDEIGKLASSIDQMEEQIQDYVEDLTRVTAEKERISTELGLATRIQADMLPNMFPAFPDRSEFDIYAVMDPAREVGGDFYDFFLIDDDHLCALIADVSGKGIPAALFMMATKIILANNAMAGKSPAQILTDTNAAICPNNKEQMFVTVWLGILEISSGRLTAANAGHEYPAIRHADGSFELLMDKHSFVIGGMEGIRYQNYELGLQPGDKLFLYTDGVPEATDKDFKLFGTARMLTALNEAPGAAPEMILDRVRRAVDGFVDKAEQFDDMTMLCLEYKGVPAAPADELEIEALLENLPKVTTFVNSCLVHAGCPEKTRGEIELAVEEIFVNIAEYAYAPGTGSARLRVEAQKDAREAVLTFIDSGIPYDPLAREDPDVTLKAEERGIGGLGIFITKKLMDELAYEYKDGCNILTMKKKLNADK